LYIFNFFNSFYLRKFLNIPSATADDAFALTALTAIDITTWLKPNPQASVIIELKSRAGRVTSHIWKFFHMVNGVKDGVDDSMLPEKWKDSQKKAFPSLFSCYNSCGDLIVVGKTKAGVGHSFSNTAMQTHLGSTKHVTTLEQLCALVESHL
jgi:hypothetical protein